MHTSAAFQHCTSLLIALAVVSFAPLGVAAPMEPLTLKEHKGWVGGIAFDPAGETLVSVSADGTVKFWNPSTGKLLATLDAHDDIIAAIAFSKDGKHIATASHDSTVKVWNAAKRELLHTFRGHRGAVLTVSFNPNGRALAAGGIDGTMRVWELDDDNPPAGRIQRRHRSWVNAIAYRPDGEGLVSGSSDNELRFNPSIGRLITVRPRLAEIRSVAYSPDSKLFATGTRYGITRIWDNSGDEVVSLKSKHGGDVWANAFSADGKWLAISDGDWNKPGDVVVYDTNDWKERIRLKHSGEVLAIAFHPTKSLLAAGAWDKTVRIWDISDVVNPKK